MVGLAAFGSMNAHARRRRTDRRRALGRLEPPAADHAAPPRTYFRTKVLTGYARRCATIVLLYIAGVTLGVSLSSRKWVHDDRVHPDRAHPVRVLGILLGHVLTADSIGPAMGGTTALLSILGGIWFPITSGALLRHRARCSLRTGSCRPPHSSRRRRLGSARLAGRRSVDGRPCRARDARVPPRHIPGLSTIGSAMADERELSLQDQLEEIGTQLDWVRGYL